MPELPEVETIVRGLRRRVVQKKIKSVQVSFAKIVSPPRGLNFLAGDRFTDFDRQGKYIKISTQKGARLVVHLRMTGQLFLAANYQPDRHVHIVIEFTGAPEKLYYRDIRKFGRWIVVPPRKNFADCINAGTDALALKLPDLAKLVQKHKDKALKVFLLDQTILAGVGNIYADETAFRLKLDPHTPVGRIPPRKLLSAVVSVLKLGIKNKGTSVSDYITSSGARGNFQNLLNVYKQKNCRRCGALVRRVKLAGRTTHICPLCQPRWNGAKRSVK
ncbi:MAG: bifunctional DNA-formamidopyrimidine glycosylase/DNA-(apurinic or apyrimidinic site) lyase [Candidatus Margulisbacteria bacterium]|jgi:formamidopyrimidine-DNA glycosylase|nr:bifunctional DNA-formamidopyrimidine glycosylase/DNA-(apurinic or apyrimidinic site) lyase [Candidatus Margulisiibacteriota bacterium]